MFGYVVLVYVGLGYDKLGIHAFLNIGKNIKDPVRSLLGYLFLFLPCSLAVPKEDSYTVYKYISRLT